jgi:hypothetical protein
VGLGFQSPSGAISDDLDIVLKGRGVPAAPQELIAPRRKHGGASWTVMARHAPRGASSTCRRDVSMLVTGT